MDKSEELIDSSSESELRCDEEVKSLSNYTQTCQSPEVVSSLWDKFDNSNMKPVFGGDCSYIKSQT